MAFSEVKMDQPVYDSSLALDNDAALLFLSSACLTYTGSATGTQNTTSRDITYQHWDSTDVSKWPNQYCSDASK